MFFRYFNFGGKVYKELDGFKQVCNVIEANRYALELKDVWDKVYKRDLYGMD